MRTTPASGTGRLRILFDGSDQGSAGAGIEVCVPDRLMATELAGGDTAPPMSRRQQRRTPGLQQLRERMREPVIRSCDARRKALVEPVFGVLKQQRGCVSSAVVARLRSVWNGHWRPRLTILPACSAETRQSKTRIDSQISLWPDQARPSARFHTHQMIIKSRESRFRSPYLKGLVLVLTQTRKGVVTKR